MMMDDELKIGAISLSGCAVVAIAGTVLLAGGGLVLNRVFGTYAEETRSQIYTQSKTYNDGMAVDLDDLCRQHRLAPDDATKAVLADTIRLRAARYDSSRLPPHIARCLENVQ